jgi:hypothetical protein
LGQKKHIFLIKKKIDEIAEIQLMLEWKKTTQKKIKKICAPSPIHIKKIINK